MSEHRSITVDDFCALLESPLPEARPLVLDTRTSSLFAARHVQSAISISLPKLLLKRIQKSSPSSLNLEELVVCDKEVLARRRTGCPVVVYDEGSVSDATSVVIISVLKAEGLDPYLLDGGFPVFLAAKPEMCVANSGTAPTVQSFVPKPSPAPGLQRMVSNAPLDAPASEILPFLLMSGVRHAEDVEFIRGSGITHVLNLTPAPFNADVAAAAKCLAIPLTDTTSQDIIDQLPAAIAFIEEARSSGGKVLVHCFAGASRSAAITIAYFLQSFNMTLDQAYNAIRDKRPCISPNLNFMGQLQKFEESLRSRHTDVLTEAAPAVRVSRTVTPVHSV